MTIMQVLYTSHVVGDRLNAAQLDDILRTASSYNAERDITGILWTDGKRFMQALEGPPEAMAETMRRITADPRHTNIVVFRDEYATTREFGHWDMAIRANLPSASPFDHRMAAYLNENHPARLDYADLAA